MSLEVIPILCFLRLEEKQSKKLLKANTESMFHHTRLIEET